MPPDCSARRCARRSCCSTGRSSSTWSRIRQQGGAAPVLFATSALGDAADGELLPPHGITLFRVLDPLLWIFHEEGIILPPAGPFSSFRTSHVPSGKKQTAMAINLSKGNVISLAKESGPTLLDRILLGLGWDPADTGARSTSTPRCLTDSWGRCATDGDFVFYGSKVHYSGAVTHCGDNLTGDGDGDDEQIPRRAQPAARLDRPAPRRGEHPRGGGAWSAFRSGEQRLHPDRQSERQPGTRAVLLERGATGQDCLTFAELFREGEDWRFRAIGDFNLGGLAGALAAHGLVGG